MWLCPDACSISQESLSDRYIDILDLNVVALESVGAAELGELVIAEDGSCPIDERNVFDIDIACAINGTVVSTILRDLWSVVGIDQMEIGEHDVSD